MWKIIVSTMLGLILAITGSIALVTSAIQPAAAPKCIICINDGKVEHYKIAQNEHFYIKQRSVQYEASLPQYKYNLTTEEQHMLATLIFLEGGNQSYECQKAIGSVILNRVDSGYWGDTLKEVIYAKNQFTPAYLISKTQPTDVQIAVVQDLMQNGTNLPYYVLYFRASFFFDWANDYCFVNDTYFSFLSKDI